METLDKSQREEQQTHFTHDKPNTAMGLKGLNTLEGRG